MLVLDDFAIRDLTTSHADDIQEIVTERAGRSLILTPNRRPEDWYPLFPTPSSPSPFSTGSSTQHTPFTSTAAATDPPADHHNNPTQLAPPQPDRLERHRNQLRDNSNNPPMDYANADTRPSSLVEVQRWLLKPQWSTK